MTEQTPQEELKSFGYTQELSRSLNLWQLTAFGLNYMIPIAPAIIFGFVLIASGGTVALPYLLAGIGMSFTALSYAVLIRHYPIAGSLYTYVSRALHPFVGFVGGWVLLLDYILIPTVTSMSAALYVRQLFPGMPYELTLFVFTICTGLINLFSVNIMARLGLWMLLIGEIVIFTGFAVWSHAVAINGVGVGHLLSLEPFKFTHISSLATATSLAVLSYLGFDAITTLSEEAKNPKRDIPRAIFLSVIIGGFTMFLTGYLGALVVPNWQQYIHVKDWAGTTLFHVAQLTGGNWFVVFYTAGFLLAMAVFNTVAVAAGARLLFGMGRDCVLPKAIFGAVHQKWKTPHWNIITIVLLEFIIGSLFQVDDVTELVDYGALLGFILLNASVIWLYYIKKQGETTTSIFKHALAPSLGVLVLVWVFAGMHSITLVIGAIWLLIGCAVRLLGYRKKV